MKLLLNDKDYDDEANLILNNLYVEFLEHSGLDGAAIEVRMKQAHRSDLKAIIYNLHSEHYRKRWSRKLHGMVLDKIFDLIESKY